MGTAVCAASAMLGCSTDATTTAPVTPTATTPAAAAPARPSMVSVSPAGVTTRIDVPAHSTEEEYFQACHAAKTWMQGRPGDAQARVEAYLAAVQAPNAAGAGTWNIPWAQLGLARQAGVIVAARAAAADECG